MKAEAAGAARAAAKVRAAAGRHDDGIKGDVLAVHDFDISPRLGL
jgi:hypothetical protein